MKRIDKRHEKAVVEPAQRYRSDILKVLADAHGYTRRSIERRIQELIKKGEMSAADEISYGTIAAALKGENLNVDSLISIAKFFNISMIRLFDYEDQLVREKEEKAS